ncbi:SET domain-containing protein [Bimuria novae-zelandiae CBS 107.79]|uniref:SET domain-containing protein n=1 Tax=Bimuria novae-zelandiae CBS 107.79 TaxID=1447943 RepID=A0A6A5V048_9PLEO|nr:SET domain-containing protein [Bimuria novae-zelandiae CBS 107.79]
MAQNTSPLWQVTHNGVTTGKGLVATRKIPKGTLIIEDMPLIKFDTRIPSAEYDDDNSKFFRQERKGQANIIQKAVSGLSEEDRTKFRDLHNRKESVGDQRVDDISIAENNAFDFDKNGTKWLSVLTVISRVNHSCAPTAYVTAFNTVDGVNLGRTKLIASKDIDVNEEITCEYSFRRPWLDVFSERQRECWRGWCFVCVCRACHEDERPRVLREWGQMRDMIRDILAPMPAPGNKKALSERVEDAEVLMNNLAKWGFSDRRVANLYARLAELNDRAGRYQEAYNAALEGLYIEGNYYDHDEPDAINERLSAVLAKAHSKLV